MVNQLTQSSSNHIMYLIPYRYQVSKVCLNSSTMFVGLNTFLNSGWVEWLAVTALWVIGQQGTVLLVVSCHYSNTSMGALSLLVFDSTVCCGTGYVLSCLPFMSEDCLKIHEQIEMIKNLKLSPDFIINIKVTHFSSDLCSAYFLCFVCKETDWCTSYSCHGFDFAGANWSESAISLFLISFSFWKFKRFLSMCEWVDYELNTPPSFTSVQTRTWSRDCQVWGSTQRQARCTSGNSGTLRRWTARRRTTERRI